MEPIQILVQLFKNPPNLTEALHDFEKFMDQRMIDYMNANLNDPARRDHFLRAVERYHKLSERATDPVMKKYFEYRCYLPDTQAKILAREFYQREIRNRVGSDTTYTQDGVEGSLADSIEYGNVFADKGMFANLTGKTVHPGRTLELDDLFTKLFDSPLLDRHDRIVLVVHLMLGTGPNLRAKAGGSDSRGMDLRTIMNEPPKELWVVEEQIEKLLKFGLGEDELTREKILFGAKKEGDNAPHVTPLMSTRRCATAIINIQAAMRKLLGIEDLTKIKQFLLKEAMGKDTKTIAVNAIVDYLGGESVPLADLAEAISYAVDLNLSKKTPLSKSKEFSNSPKEIKITYLKLASTGKELDIMKVQDLFMAPVIDKQVKAG